MKTINFAVISQSFHMNSTLNPSLLITFSVHGMRVDDRIQAMLRKYQYARRINRNDDIKWTTNDLKYKITSFFHLSHLNQVTCKAYFIITTSYKHVWASYFGSFNADKPGTFFRSAKARFHFISKCG